tara:strand:- start:38408 stop:40900 length:2493 start_codon:yes stop_codon:yes gene_type:complete
MIVSGENFRSLVERNQLSFSAQMSLNNTTGMAELGFLGESGLSFKFENGKIIDPENRYFNSYSKNESFTLSGNLATGSYDYYIDGNLNCSIGVKDNFTIDQFYINTTGVEINGDFYIYSTPQDYTVQYADKYVLNKSLLGNIYNNQREEFKIFTGTVSNPSFELDVDVPTGNYDGTYIQDYKYYVGSGDLDECNGRFGITPEYPDGVYHYHITNNWPYVMSCFKGEAANQIQNVTETISGTAPDSIPTPWQTDKFFDRQTHSLQKTNIRQYASGVSAEYSDNYIYIKSNGLPRHFYGPFSGSPNDVEPQKHLFRIPLNPNSGEVPQVIPMGKVGVAIDGVPIDLLSNEFYKDRGRWRLAVHPDNFGLDDYNAHVQPDGTYHYHVGFSGIINDYQFTTPSITVGNIPSEYKVFDDIGFSKYSNAFGVNVFATSGVSNQKISHAANVLAELIDNDQDGIPDNVNVLNTLKGHQASIIMASGAIQSEGMNYSVEGVSGIDVTKLSGYHALQELRGENVHTGSHAIIDETLEKTLKLMIDYGWSETYPYTFGLLSGSTLANYMDTARSGHFEWCETHKMSNNSIMSGPIHGSNQTCLSWGAIPWEVGKYENGKSDGRYPSGSWYYDISSDCDDYSCQSSKYMYLGISTILGANTGDLNDLLGIIKTLIIKSQWDFNTPTGFQSGDSNFYNLLTNPQYNIPTGYLPTGGYNPSSTETILGNTGHSPLIGFAFDGYPIYGPMGYTNALVSGEVKEMKSSYLPKNTEREAAYPKIIKQYNDLYLPYSVDLINKHGSLNTQDINVEVTLHTNFGDIKESLIVEEVTEWDEELKKLGYK